MAQTHLCVNADSPRQEDTGNIVLLRARGCFNHDESVCAFPEAEETGHWKSSSKMARRKLVGTNWHSLTRKEKNIIVSG